MEALERRDNGRPPRGEPRELEGALDGLGAAVHEEGVLQVARRNLGDPAGQGRLGPGEEHASAHGHAAELVAHGGDHRCRAVAQAHDTEAAQAVDVLHALGVVHPGAHRVVFDRLEAHEAQQVSHRWADVRLVVGVDGLKRTVRVEAQRESPSVCSAQSSQSIT